MMFHFIAFELELGILNSFDKLSENTADSVRTAVLNSSDNTIAVHKY